MHPSFVQRLLAELPALLRVARRLTWSEADAEDLVQATVERAFARGSDLREGEKMRAWLLQVERSVLLNSHRGLRRRLEVLEGGRNDGPPVERTIEPAGNLETELLDRSFAGEVQRALDALPAEWRDALLLREVEDLSYDEIAEALRCPVGTVRSRLARARAALFERLSEPSKQEDESWQDAIKSGSRTSRRGTTAK